MLYLWRGYAAHLTLLHIQMMPLLIAWHLSGYISATIGVYRFTVAVNDADSMTVTVTATVSVVMAADLSGAIPPRLEVTAGIAEEVYVFAASGGIMPHTYTLLLNPDANAFVFSNGTLSLMAARPSAYIALPWLSTMPIA